MTPHTQRWHSLKEHIRFKYAPRVADWLVGLSTLAARKKLRNSGPLAVLVDNTVLHHAITHETAWVSTGKSSWGPHEVDTGYAARIAVHSADSGSREYRNIQYLPGLAHLAKKGLIQLKSSSELNDERFRQPSGRFGGYGYYDFSVFGDVRLESVDGFVSPAIGPSNFNIPEPVKQQRERLMRARSNPLYEGIVRRLGEKNSQDAWHIFTAEIHDLYCFLTMDFKLLRTIASVANVDPIKSLHTLVLTPEDFGRRLGLLPIHPHILSYTRAGFPVRSDLCWPDGKRRPLKSYRKPYNKHHGTR